MYYMPHFFLHNFHRLQEPSASEKQTLYQFEFYTRSHFNNIVVTRLWMAL
jgi:hypothetical protein